MCQHRAMNRKRLTREDSREETRKHLLDAARRLIAKKGLSTASVEDIVESAGYTRARQIYGQMYRDSESFMNWNEAHMLAARNSKFRTKLNALLTEKRGEVVGFIEYFYRRAGIAAPVPAKVMGVGFMSLFEGVRLSTLSSPDDMTTDNAESILTLFIESVMRLARLQRSRDDRTDPDQVGNSSTIRLSRSSRR
jgi:hypothetical protein